MTYLHRLLRWSGQPETIIFIRAGSRLGFKFSTCPELGIMKPVPVRYEKSMLDAYDPLD